jgi:hypothetical protein
VALGTTSILEEKVIYLKTKSSSFSWAKTFMMSNLNLGSPRFYHDLKKNQEIRRITRIQELCNSKRLVHYEIRKYLIHNTVFAMNLKVHLIILMGSIKVYK